MTHNLENQKTEMVKSLKAFVVPKIQSLGFSGEFPDFRREKKERFEFLSFQFERHGGSFALEAAFAAKKDLLEFSKNLPFEKLTVVNTHEMNRLRIKPEQAHGDFWFSYGDFTESAQFEKMAHEVSALLSKVEHFLNH